MNVLKSYHQRLSDIQSVINQKTIDLFSKIIQHTVNDPIDPVSHIKF